MKSISWESRVSNSNGVHCRVASQLTEIVAGHDAEVQIMAELETVDCTSMLEILSLSLSHGSLVSFAAQGPEAQQVAEAIEELLASDEEGF